MNIKIILLLSIFLSNTIICAQEEKEMNWWNPLEQNIHVIEGQAWTDGLESEFHRLPIEAKGKVREPLWNLSKNSAGLSIRFRSNSPVIIVKYTLGGEIAMPHMPATGVSGLDLYAKNSDGEWIWVQGNYSINEKAEYTFKDLKPNDGYHKMGREYKLYLPLYNEVTHLEIGQPIEALFKPLEKRKEKPIVVYGTSIAQGACASRPGMAWTSILERKLDVPLINFGFSGNGLLEEEIINYMNQVDAKVYVLDCLPNLTPNDELPLSDIYHRIISSVQQLRRKKSKTPILLVEHAGYTDGYIHEYRGKIYQELNKTMKSAFAELKSEGINDIYLLTREELNLGLDDMVDGTHPSDLGMASYAKAYETSLRAILKQPTQIYSTTIPLTQSREWHFYRWEERHQELMRLNKISPPKICFFGNSIVHFWGGSPSGPIARDTRSWNKYLGKLEVRNFGFGWDRIENVLWRVYHGELDGFEADQVVIMLGTNNLQLNSDDDILAGLKILIEAVQIRQPKARMLILGILPRREMEERVAILNLKILQLAGTLNTDYGYLGSVFLKESGSIDESLFSDGLHPNELGYKKMAPLLASYLKE